MKTYPQEPPKKEDSRDFSHLTWLQFLMRILAILLISGVLSFIFFKIVFF